MLTIFMAVMSLTSWSLFQQLDRHAQDQDIEAVTHTVRELAKTQRLWHVRHGEGVPWQDRYLTHVPDNCPSSSAPSCENRWLRLSASLWYCEITQLPRKGDRLPVFGRSPSCPSTISGQPINGEIVDREGNPRGSSPTVAESSVEGQAVPWWDADHVDAGNYATWATRDGANSLAADYSFQVIYRAGPDNPGAAAAGEWERSRRRAHRIANALGALACVGRREGSGPLNAWYDCDEGSEIGRRRGPGGATPADNAPYYVVARYEKPLARTMVETMLPRDGKMHAYGDLTFRAGTHSVSRPREMHLAHDTGSLSLHAVNRLTVGCGNVDDCFGPVANRAHVDLDARGAHAVTQRGQDPVLPGLYLRTNVSNESPVRLTASPTGPNVKIGNVEMFMRDTNPHHNVQDWENVVKGVLRLKAQSLPNATEGVKLTNIGRAVVCSDQNPLSCPR